MNLTAMSDERLYADCVDAITKAAYGNEAAYDYAMRLMVESQARHRAAGHSERCGSDVYSRALAEAQARQTFTELHEPVCNCGASR